VVVPDTVDNSDPSNLLLKTKSKSEMKGSCVITQMVPEIWSFKAEQPKVKV
jgi:hypothetical protein